MSGKARFFILSDMECPVAVPAGAGIAEVFSAPRPGRREGNEDAVAILPVNDGSAVLALADGAGGLPGGRKASARSLEILGGALFRAVRRGGEVRHGILDGFEEANRALLADGGCGATTLVVAEIAGNTIRPYHAGDSGLLLA